MLSPASRKVRIRNIETIRGKTICGRVRICLRPSLQNINTHKLSTRMACVTIEKAKMSQAIEALQPCLWFKSMWSISCHRTSRDFKKWETRQRKCGCSSTKPSSFVRVKPLQKSSEIKTSIEETPAKPSKLHQIHSLCQKLTCPPEIMWQLWQAQT